MDLNSFFNQYLRDIRIPSLEYFLENNMLKYRWKNTIEDFKMPLKISIAQKEQWIQPTAKWQTMSVEGTNLKVDPNFYVESKMLKKDAPE